MAEQCGADVPDDVDEHSRDDRIECYYQVWGAREMAERIVDLEDELGADVDGICTGMHADVAEAHAEIERLTSLVGYWEHRAEEATELKGRLEGDCVRLSEELDEARTTNTELARDARDGAHWEAVAGRMRDEISRLKDLLAYEHSRANSAIDRETTAEEHAEELAAKLAEETERADVNCEVAGQWAELAERRRLAWLSARRRAADEANFGMEAMELRDQEIRLLRQEVSVLKRYGGEVP